MSGFISNMLYGRIHSTRFLLLASKARSAHPASMRSNYILHQQHVEDLVVEWVLSIAWVTESLCMSLEGKHEQILVF